MKRAAIAWLALALAGCGRTVEEPPETRPVWRGATIDGLAPLMSPEQVQVALDRAGYRQAPCVPGDPLLADPLHSGNDAPCYQSPSRPMRLHLFFLDLVEGRRLAVINFNPNWATDSTAASEIADGRGVLAWLRARFGTPSIVSKGSAFTSYYWNRPGGTRSLPDHVSTTVGASFGANVTMTSMWAYGQTAPEHRPPAAAPVPPEAD